MRLRNIPAAKGAIEASPYCIQDPEKWKGNWTNIFLNDNPIHIEIGMGKGQFLLSQAQSGPDINMVGLERYESVMYRAVQRLERMETVPENMKMICCDAKDVASFFEKGEVHKIYLNFSDPWPKARHAKRRLTSRNFLAEYEKILPEGGMLEFKTDNTGLFTFSIEEIAGCDNWELIAVTDDLHHDTILSKGNIMTEYEEKFAAEGKPIHKLTAVFRCEESI